MHRPLMGDSASLTSLAVELMTLSSAQTSVLDMTCRLLRKLESGCATASMQTHVSSTVRPVSSSDNTPRVSLTPASHTPTQFIIIMPRCGGSVAEWLACWTQAQ